MKTVETCRLSVTHPLHQHYKTKSNMNIPVPKTSNNDHVSSLCNMLALKKIDVKN